MLYRTINTREAIRLFNQFMERSSEIRIFGLLGDGKMGKTHLLTNVFPSLAQEFYQARLAILDLRYQFHSVPEILDLACSQLGDRFEGYYAADQVWIKRPKVDIKDLHVRFSRIGINAKGSIDDAHDRDRYLTNQFVRDVSELDDKPLLLLFDTIDRANEAIRMWLMEMLLVKLASLDHVRVVVAGRSLPEAYTSYRTLCQGYHLLPVKEIQAYITYCKSVDPTLSEQLIQILAHAFDYIPGLFAEAIPKFTSNGQFNG